MATTLTDKDIAQHDKWSAYKDSANSYLSRFPGTPLTGDILVNASKKAYEKHGVDVPAELALSQAQFETQMGKKGRNPATNPFNVYEYDNRTAKKFKTIDEGVNAYYDLMARRYLKGKDLDQLLGNFTNDEGKRYASDKGYEKKISGQVKYIRDFWDKNKQVKKNNQESVPGGFKSAFAEARKSGKSNFIYQGKKYTTKVK